MLCPSCFNDNLAPTGEGKLVCDDCGEEFAGFREEQMDDLMAGTAMSRVSQASQAKSVRDKIQSRERSQSTFGLPPTHHVVSDEIAVCESVFLLARAIADRLIQLKYTSSRIKEPLFEILTHWVRRRHAGVKSAGPKQPTFKSHIVLALISLAAMYIRSPILPRDLCRLIALRQIPFLTALNNLLPKHLTASQMVVDAFALNSIPVAHQIAENINVFGTDQFAWPPLRQFFISNRVNKRPYGNPVMYLRSHPVGHLHITLLRMSRLLGLPDEFGARVLRFMELRRIATKMARVMNNETDGPWDSSQLDTYDVGHIPFYIELERPFSKTVAGSVDNFGFPTDLSVQADFINTMRLCYGSRNSKYREASNKVDHVHAREDQMAREWEACKSVMMKWLSNGSDEDRGTVLWTSLSLNVHFNLQGKALEEYSQYVDDMLFGEKVPAFMAKFANVFEDIAKEGGNGESSQQIIPHGCLDEIGCMYNPNQSTSTAYYAPNEGKEEMQKQCRFSSCDDAGVIRRPLLLLPLRAARIYSYRERRKKKEEKEVLALHSQNQRGVRFAAKLEDGCGIEENFNDDGALPSETKGNMNGLNTSNIENENVQSNGGTQNGNCLELEAGIKSGKSGKRKEMDVLKTEDSPTCSPAQKRRKVERSEKVVVLSENNSMSFIDPTQRVEMGNGSQNAGGVVQESKVLHMASNGGEENLPHPENVEDMLVNNEATQNQKALSAVESPQHKRESLQVNGFAQTTQPSNSLHEPGSGEKSSKKTREWSRLGLEKGKVPWWIAFKSESGAVVGRAMTNFRKSKESYKLEYLDFLEEPCGIGLAWTIIRRFFAGSSIEIDGTEYRNAIEQRWIRDMVSGCNRSLQLVTTYIIGLQHDLQTA